MSREEGAPGAPHDDDELTVEDTGDGDGDGDESAPSVEALITDLEAITAGSSSRYFRSPLRTSLA